MTTHLTYPHSRRRLGIIVMLIVLVTTTITALIPASAHAVRVSRVERAELVLINRYRQAHGLRKLRIDRRLTRTADWMAADMPRNDYFGHEDSRGRNPFERLAVFGYPSNTWRGENLAAGNADAASTFIQWRNSAPHRANMLTARYRAIGISRVCRSDSRYRCYWVTEFGSRVTSRIR